jgi:transketolase-like protein
VPSPVAGQASWTALDIRAVDTARLLATDAVQKVGNGHLGTAMSLAPPAHLLFHDAMRHDPNDDQWLGRELDGIIDIRDLHQRRIVTAMRITPASARSPGSRAGNVIPFTAISPVGPHAPDGIGRQHRLDTTMIYRSSAGTPAAEDLQNTGEAPVFRTCGMRW